MGCYNNYEDRDCSHKHHNRFDDRQRYDDRRRFDDRRRYEDRRRFDDRHDREFRGFTTDRPYFIGFPRLFR